jgi:thiamine-phosphate pyrophosphorylase
MGGATSASLPSPLRSPLFPRVFSVSRTTSALPALNAIVDADTAARAGLSVPALARAYLAGGARFLQLRAKQATGREFLAWADEIAADVRRHDGVFVVNDRADIAALAGVAGVHVGQDDLPVEAVRRVIGEHAWVGLSTHTPEQIDAALREPIGYLAVGPVFGTRTKDTGYQPVGLQLVRHAAARAGGVPVVAIGGITLATAPEVLAAGASAVAIITDLVSTGDPGARAAEFVAALA